jgi:hypothetical protein
VKGEGWRETTEKEKGSLVAWCGGGRWVLGGFFCLAERVRQDEAVPAWLRQSLWLAAFDQVGPIYRKEFASGESACMQPIGGLE